MELYLHQSQGGDDRELVAYSMNGLFPFEKSNCIVHLCDRAASNVTFSIAKFDSIFPLNVPGSAAVFVDLRVVPDTSVQMAETLSSGGVLNCMAFACQS